MHFLRKALGVGGVLLLVVVLVAACGSSSSDSSSQASGSTSGGSGGGTNKLDAFKAKVNADVAKAQQKSTTVPPTSGPKAQAGKSVFVIGCSFQAEGCARPAKAADEAAKAIGWKSTLIDTGGDPTKAANAIRQAISQKANGIVTAGFDSPALQAPLADARKAGLKLVGAVGTNKGNGFDYTIPGSLEPDGYVMGEMAYKLSGYNLKLLMFTGNEFGVVQQRVTGTEKFVQDCVAAGGQCKILGKQDVIAANLGTQVPGQAASFARSHPDFNVIYAPYDGAASFIEQGVKQSGLPAANSPMVGFDANAPNLDVIRKGGYEKATMGFPLEWLGYASIDTLNRLFAGRKPVVQSTLKKMLTQDNVPASGAWEGDDPNFRQQYKQLWGK